MGGCVNKEADRSSRVRQQQTQQQHYVQPQQYQQPIQHTHLVTYDTGGRHVIQHVSSQQPQYMHPWPQGQRMLHFFNQHLLAAVNAADRQNKQQQQQVSDVPEVTEARNLRNYANIQKDSLRLIKTKDKSFLISFKLDCLVETSVSIFAACREEGLKTGDLVLKSVHRSSQVLPMRKIKVEAGNDVVV